MIWNVFKTAIDQWFCHRSARLGAALAYYSVFSMGPLLLIVTSVAGLFFGVGDTGSKAVEAMLAGASSEQSGRLAALSPASCCCSWPPLASSSSSRTP